jgi:hypothetical protein
MRFEEYLTEKKIPMTGDQWKNIFIKQLNSWDSDLRKMTKLYKSLKAENTPRALKEFQRAKKAFQIFNKNLEFWVYDKLLSRLTFNNKDESVFSKDVRTAAWDALHHLRPYQLFPEAYDYKIDKHADAPWELDYGGARKLQISRYQRAWRKTIDTIHDYIKYQSKELSESMPDEQIQVSGVTIKIKNITDKKTAEKWTKKFLKHLPKAIAAVKKAGLDKSIKDFSIEMNFKPATVDGIPGGLVGGAYQKRDDTLYMFPLGLTDNISDSTLIHEIGHRFWFRHVPARAKKAWKDKIESNNITIERKHIDEFFKRYWNSNEVGKYTIEGLMTKNNMEADWKKIDDPTLSAVFKPMVDHHPLFMVDDDKDKKTVYYDWMIKQHKGEQVPLEWISDYGRTNEKEAFAEVFKLWVGGRKQKLGPWTRAFFKDIVRTGGANITEETRLKNFLLLEKRQPMFHGTRSRNLSGIKSGGLRIGSPSNKGVHGYTDTDDKIFMSDNYNDAFQQITQFVTNGEPIAILQINPVFDYQTLNKKGEWVSYEDIPASLISIWMPKVKQRSYKKQKFQLISIKKIKPENINYINFDFLHGADLSVAQKYWSN